MANAKSLDGLMNWLHRDEWRGPFAELWHQHLEPACANADVSFDELPDILGSHHFGVLWGCVFEDFLAHDLDDGRNIVDDYVKRRGWKESVANKAYMTALRSSVMSLYEISDIVPEEGFLARDLLRGGEPVRVHERSGTRYLKAWDRMAARMVRVGSRTEMAGGAMPFDFEASRTVLKILRQEERRAREKAGKAARPSRRRSAKGTPTSEALFDTSALRASAHMFTNVWLDRVLQRIRAPIVPQMYNSDGDELVFTTVSYPLDSGAHADAIRSALSAIPSLWPESETFWNWVGPATRTKKKQPAGGRMFITTLDDGSLVLGTLEIRDKLLILQANSRQRADRGRAMIEPALRGFVADPDIQTESVQKVLASAPAGRSDPPRSGLSSEDERAFVREAIEQHYMKVLDEPVPMLGDLTPRQAARSAKGREQLCEWLKYLENSAARQQIGSVMSSDDLAWMWDELGIADLRR
jgi:hypothetical protein